jgi:hypothetical protein
MTAHDIHRKLLIWCISFVYTNRFLATLSVTCIISDNERCAVEPCLFFNYLLVIISCVVMEVKEIIVSNVCRKC